jgi:hypothetical protein
VGEDAGEEVLLYVCLGSGGGEVILRTLVILSFASCNIISVSTKIGGKLNRIRDYCKVES